MVTTTFAAVVLGTVLSTGAATPTWQTDYDQAMTTAVAQQKPLAVFIGSGDTGYSRLVSGGEIPAEASQLLAKSYVSVYVNTETKPGKALAEKFGVSKGLVISSKCCNFQALQCTGTVAPADLTGYLTRYSSATQVIATTEKVGAVAPTPAFFGGCPNGRCGVSAAPVSGCVGGHCGFVSPAPVASCASGHCGFVSAAPVSGCASGHCGVYGRSFAPSYPAFGSCSGGRCR